MERATAVEVERQMAPHHEAYFPRGDARHAAAGGLAAAKGRFRSSSRLLAGARFANDGRRSFVGISSPEAVPFPPRCRASLRSRAAPRQRRLVHAHLATADA